MPNQPLKKLWGMAAHRADAKEKKRDLFPKAPIDELVKASQVSVKPLVLLYYSSERGERNGRSIISFLN